MGRTSKCRAGHKNKPKNDTHMVMGLVWGGGGASSSPSVRAKGSLMPDSLSACVGLRLSPLESVPVSFLPILYVSLCFVMEKKKEGEKERHDELATCLVFAFLGLAVVAALLLAWIRGAWAHRPTYGNRRQTKQLQVAAVAAAAANTTTIPSTTMQQRWRPAACLGPLPRCHQRHRAREAFVQIARPPGLLQTLLLPQDTSLIK